MSRRVGELVRGLTGLTTAPYQVLRSLAWYADGAGKCAPSLITLASDSAVNKRTAIRAIQRLASPYSSLEPRPLLAIAQGGGRGKRNAYSLNLELLKALKAAHRKRSCRPRSSGLNAPPAEGSMSVHALSPKGGMQPPSPSASGSVDGGVVSRQGGIRAEAMNVNQRMRLHVQQTALSIRAGVQDDLPPPEFW
jgi:Helix-turn-helix domain